MGLLPVCRPPVTLLSPFVVPAPFPSCCPCPLPFLLSLPPSLLPWQARARLFSARVRATASEMQGGREAPLAALRERWKKRWAGCDRARGPSPTPRPTGPVPRAYRPCGPELWPRPPGPALGHSVSVCMYVCVCMYIYIHTCTTCLHHSNDGHGGGRGVARWRARAAGTRGASLAFRPLSRSSTRLRVWAPRASTSWTFAGPACS